MDPVDTDMFGYYYLQIAPKLHNKAILKHGMFCTEVAGPGRRFFLGY